MWTQFFNFLGDYDRSLTILSKSGVVSCQITILCHHSAQRSFELTLQIDDAVWQHSQKKKRGEFSNILVDLHVLSAVG